MRIKKQDKLSIAGENTKKRLKCQKYKKRRNKRKKSGIDK